MQAVPFAADEVVDDKRETTGELTITTEAITAPFTSKPEAIVRPLRRREPSDDDTNRSPDLQNLEAQIIDKLTKLEKPKPLKESIRDIEKKHYRWNPSRDSKKSSRDVSVL